MRIIFLFLICFTLVGCGASTTYNVYFHTGSFRVSDKLVIEPGQGGDDSSSTSSGETAGGTESSPGGSNLLRGYAQQGNIFQIGTSQRPSTEATTDANADLDVTPSP